MNDLISRQAAIDFINAGHLVNPNEPRWSDNEVVNFLKSRPSAQRTGRKKGKWIDVNGNGNLYECDQCHDRSCCAGKYCMMCGARMEEQE